MNSYFSYELNLSANESSLQLICHSPYSNSPSGMDLWLKVIVIIILYCRVLFFEVCKFHEQEIHRNEICDSAQEGVVFLTKY